MNHRFLLRLTTTLTVWLLTLSCLGIVLWVIDEFLGWDILPDALSLVVRALLVAGGIIATVLVVMNTTLSLALIAEANASRARLPNYGISQRFKQRVRRGMVLGVLAIAFTLGGLQVINQVRTQAAIREARVEFSAAQAEMNQSVAQVIELFTPELVEAIDSNSLAEQGQIGNLKKLLDAVEVSFPYRPSLSLLTPAEQAPYRYAHISADAIRASSQGRLLLSPQLYTSFPTEQEIQAVEQLFARALPELEGPLDGTVIRNTVPSAWGLLTRSGEPIAIVYLEARELGEFGPLLFDQQVYHSGPDRLVGAS